MFFGLSPEPASSLEKHTKTRIMLAVKYSLLQPVEVGAIFHKSNSLNKIR